MGRSNIGKSDAKQEDIPGEGRDVYGARPGVKAGHDEESDYSDFGDD